MEKTMIKHPTEEQEESKSSIAFSPTYLNEESSSTCSPIAYYDSSNRKVFIVAPDKSG
jgi:hypothetical protein